MNERKNNASRKTFRQRLSIMVDRLREEIRSGVYKAGDFIPSETKLVERFKLSNKSVRKGLEQLIEEGLVVKVNRVGSKVADVRQEAPIILSFGYHASIERDIQLSGLLETFRERYPHIRVKPVKLVFSDYTSVKDYLESGIIDLFTINNIDFMALADSRAAGLLEPLPADAGAYRFANEAFEYEGVQFAKPVIYSPVVLAYNRDHFAERQVPEPDGGWTWEQAIRYAADLAVPGERHGLCFHLLSDNRWPAFLLQSGSGFHPDEDGELRLEGTRMLDSIRLCKDIISNRDMFPGYLSENNHDVNDLFKQGGVSMILTTYMALNDMNHADIRYDISPMPYLSEPRSLLNIIGMAVSSRSKEKEAAKLLADFISSPEAQRWIRERSLSLPAHKETAEEPVPAEEALNRPSRYFSFRELLFSYRTHRELNLSIHQFKRLRQLLKRYWSGLLSEEELCEAIRPIGMAPENE